MKQKSLVLFIVLLFTGLAAFYFMKSQGSKQADSHARDSNGHPPVNAPDFNLSNTSGKNISLSDFRGKVLVINFFATWCPPCKDEIPGFVNVYNRLKDHGFAIIGISLDSDTRDELPGFIKKYGITYPIVLGNREIAARYGKVQTIPATFLVDRKGMITDAFIGVIEENNLEDMVKKLL